MGGTGHKSSLLAAQTQTHTLPNSAKAKALSK